MIKFIIIWNKRKRRIKITWQSQGLDLLKSESLEKQGEESFEKERRFWKFKNGEEMKRLS